MKKIFTTTAIAMIAFLVVTTNASAQDYAFSTIPIKKTFILPPDAIDDTLVTLESAKANLASSSTKSMKEVKKAAREFKQFSRITKIFERNFSGASNVSWDKQESGYTAIFTKDGLRNMVWFDRSGAQTYAMVNYSENNLRADVKKVVTNHYKNYRILLVNEIHKDGNIIYLLTIEDDKNIKQVTVCDGELNVYKEFKKAA